MNTLVNFWIIKYKIDPTLNSFISFFKIQGRYFNIRQWTFWLVIIKNSNVESCPHKSEKILKIYFSNCCFDSIQCLESRLVRNSCWLDIQLRWKILWLLCRRSNQLQSFSYLPRRCRCQVELPLSESNQFSAGLKFIQWFESKNLKLSIQLLFFFQWIVLSKLMT